MVVFKLSRSIVGVGLLLGVVVSQSGCNQAGPALAQTSGTAASEATVVNVVDVTVTTIQRTTTQPATVHAYHEAEIFAKASGFLIELKADIGQSVSKGDVLAVLAVPEMERSREKQEASIRQLEAAEVSAAASVKLAIADVLASKAALAQAEADVAKTLSQLNADRSEFERVTQLVEQKAVAGRLLDETRQRYESSQSTKTAAEAALESAAAAVTVASERQAVAEADVNGAKAATDVARKQLEELDALMAYATLLTPFDGVVTQRHVDPGDLVRNVELSGDSARKPLFEVAQIDRVRVRVAVPENDAPFATPGDKATVTMRAIPGRTFPGEISRVARRLDEGTRTMLVEIDLPNEDGLLLPGMFGEAQIALSETANATLVPATAVRFDEKGNGSVYVLGDDSSVRMVAVTTGHDDGRQIQILNGLDASARIVDGRVGRLQDGQKVRVQ